MHHHTPLCFTQRRPSIQNQPCSSPVKSQVVFANMKQGVDRLHNPHQRPPHLFSRNLLHRHTAWLLVQTVPPPPPLPLLACLGSSICDACSHSNEICCSRRAVLHNYQYRTAILRDIQACSICRSLSICADQVEAGEMRHGVCQHLHRPLSP